jgi:hypothetical protein
MTAHIHHPLRAGLVSPVGENSSQAPHGTSSIESTQSVLRRRDDVNDATGLESMDMQALLTDGPLKGKLVEIEPVEGRPPATLDIESDDESTVRYCLSQLDQRGMTAAYSFLYAV